MKVRLITVTAAVSVAIFAASASAQSIAGSVATYSWAPSCSSSVNLGFASVGLNSPTIYHSAGFYQQRVDWYVVLYKLTPSGPVVANVDHRSGTISGSGYFTNPIVFRADSNGYRLTGTFQVRSLVFWWDGSGNLVDEDDAFFATCPLP